MLVSVKFHVAMREVRMLQSSARKEFRKKKAAIPLRLLLPCWRVASVLDAINFGLEHVITPKWVYAQK